MTGSGDKPSASAADARTHEPDPRDVAARLPRDFVLGAATAAPPIEGAADHDHRSVEDLALLSDAGLDSCRFSVSWPRVQPTGGGPADPVGLDFYDRLVDRLLERGICPMATLLHRDAPLPLEERGGWGSRDTAKRFGEYAALVGERLGDRVVDWVTINAAATVVMDGYGPGVPTPGRARLRRAGAVARTLLLGHGHAVRALRSVPVRGRIGIANIHTPLTPVTESTQDRTTDGLLDFIHHRLLADPVLLRRSPEPPSGLPLPLRLLLRSGTRMSRKDLALIGAPIDFYGLSCCSPSQVAAGTDPDAMSPDGLRRVAEELAGRYGSRLPPVVITEGGAGLPDPVGPDGVVDEQDRVASLAEHLEVAGDLACGGVPGFGLEGYYGWTLLDDPTSSYRWVGELQAARGRRRS